MAPKNPIVDTDSIGKKIGLKLYLIADKNWITQTTIAERMWVTTPSISFLLTGKKSTGNLDQYWKIAEAIPISRPEFDQIVETAKAEVLWISEHNSWTKLNRETAMSFLAREENVAVEDIQKALDAVKFFKSKQ